MSTESKIAELRAKATEARELAAKCDATAEELRPLAERWLAMHNAAVDARTIAAQCDAAVEALEAVGFFDIALATLDEEAGP